MNDFNNFQVKNLLSPAHLGLRQLLHGTSIVVLLCLLASITLPAHSQNRFSIAAYYNCTRESAIIEAFDLMASSQNASPALDIIVNKPIRVIFKDLKTLDKRVKDYDALSYMTANGQLIIFVNQKHANAPKAALAAILTHEAMHNDAHNSMNEEVAGWTQEAQVWHEMKQRNPELASLPKGSYPLVDRLNTLESHLQKGTLASFVRERPGYAGLPDHSPGF